MKLSIFIVAIASFLQLGVIYPETAQATGSVLASPKILFISSFGKDFPGQTALEAGLKKTLETSPIKHELYFEFMDNQQQRGIEFWLAFSFYLEKKYQPIELDYIIVWADEAAYFLNLYPDLLPAAKRIYLQKPEQLVLQPQNLYSVHHFTGNFKKSIEEFLALARPEHILVIGSTENRASKARLADFQLGINKIASEATVEYLIDQPLDSLVRRLSSENRADTAVFYTVTFSDGQGRQMTPEAVISVLTEKSRIPVFGFFESFLGHGVVGGYTISHTRIGEILGEMLVPGKFSGGNVLLDPMRFAFDWAALKRWNLDKSMIPGQAIIINRPPLLLKEFYPQIVLGFVFILGQMVMIGLLVINQSRLNKAERELKQHRHNLELLVAERTKELQKSQQKLETAKAVANLGIWELDHANNHLTWSDEIYQLFELDKMTTAPSVDGLLTIIHPEDRGQLEADFRDSITKGKKFKNTHRIVMKDGRVKWVHSQCDTQFDERGQPLFSLGTAYDITQQKEGEEKFKSYLELASDGVHVLDKNGNVYECSHSFADSLGYSYEEALTLNIKDWVGDSYLLMGDLMPRLKIRPETFETIYRRKDGSTFNVLVSAKIIKLNGEIMLYASVRDITERKRAIEERLAKERQLRAITDTSLDAILMMDPKGEISFWNPAAEKILGYTASEVIGKNLHELLASARYQAEHKAAFPKFLREGTGSAVGKILEVHARHKDGHEFPVAVSICAFKQDQQWYGVGTIRDITVQKEAEAALSQRLDDLVEASVTDKLTGLYNRRKLDECLEYEIHRASRYQLPFAVVLLDMDHFKAVNDKYGHLVGDQVLQSLAKILNSNIRSVDILGRWGGEEFLIICPQATLPSAIELAEKLRKSVEEHTFPSVGTKTCSFGVASWAVGDNKDKLADKADRALYRAKERRNCVVAETLVK